MVDRNGGPVSVHLRQRPGPYQVVMLSTATLGGLVIVLRSFGVGGPMGDVGVTWTVPLLGGSLVLTSGVALTGIVLAVRRKRIIGPLIERAGLTGQVLLLTVYTVLVLVQSGERAIVTAIFFLGFVVSGVWRLTQIRSQYKETLSAIERKGDPDRE